MLFVEINMQRHPWGLFLASVSTTWTTRPCFLGALIPSLRPYCRNNNFVLFFHVSSGGWSKKVRCGSHQIVWRSKGSLQTPVKYQSFATCINMHILHILLPSESGLCNAVRATFRSPNKQEYTKMGSNTKTEDQMNERMLLTVLHVLTCVWHQSRCIWSRLPYHPSHQGSMSSTRPPRMDFC